MTSNKIKSKKDNKSKLVNELRNKIRVKQKSTE